MSELFPTISLEKFTTHLYFKLSDYFRKNVQKIVYSVVKWHRRLQSLDWRPVRWYWLYGGIERELSTMKFWNLVKRSIRYFTVNNWPDYRKQFKRIARNWSIEKALCSITTTPGHTHFWWLAKSWLNPENGKRSRIIMAYMYLYNIDFQWRKISFKH